MLTYCHHGEMYGDISVIFYQVLVGGYMILNRIVLKWSGEWVIDEERDIISLDNSSMKFNSVK